MSVKPEKPPEFILKSIDLKDFDTAGERTSLDELVKLIPNDIDLKNVFIDLQEEYYYDGCDRSIRVKLVATRNVPNPHFDKQLKSFNKKMKQYELKLEEFKTKEKEYKAYLKIKNKEDVKKRILFLEKELTQLRTQA